MDQFDLDESKSIALIPNPTTALYPALSIGVLAFFFHSFDWGEIKNTNDYWALTAIISMSASGFVPTFLRPYKLYSTSKYFILKKPFGRIEVIAKSQAMTVDHFWTISGLYNTHAFGRNFHNNKKIVKFINRHMNKQQTR